MSRSHVVRLLRLILTAVILLLCALPAGARAACSAACVDQAFDQAGAAEAVLAQEATPAATTEPTAQPEQPAPAPASAPVQPVGTQAPRRVKVNFFVNSLGEINDEANAYVVDMYLDLYWLDPALEGKTIDEVDTSTLWDPGLDMINGQEVRTLFKTYDNSLEADTNVRQSYRLVGTYLGRFDLRKFPFDQQVFSVVIESSTYDSSQLLFDFLALEQEVIHSEKGFEQPIPLGRYISSDISLDGWTIDDAKVVQVIDVLAYDKSSWSQFRIDLTLTRTAGPYLWKIILVLAFLMLLLWGVLFIDARELRYRLLSLFTLILTTVAFHFTMSAILPKISYLTFMDIYLIAVYGACALVAVVTVLARFLYEANRSKLADRLNRTAIIIYPLLFVVTNASLFWYATS